MENMDFGRTSIDEEIGISIDRAKAISIDKSTGISVDDAHQTSIDNIPPEAGKYSPTNDANERVVLGKPKERDNEWKLPLQDYLNPGRTYSNRSAIRLPKDDTKKFGISPEYLIMVRHPFRGTDLERPYDNIEYLEELINDEYNRCKFFPFSLEGDARKWLDQIPTGYLTCWKEIRSAFINQFFDEAHYWDARRKISTFRQNPWESFINAWERFKSYQLECPHHGYSEPFLPKSDDSFTHSARNSPFSPFRSLNSRIIMADERRTKRRFDTNSPAPVPDRDPWPRQPEAGPIPLFENFPDTRKAAKSLESRNSAIQDA
ncbi:hypothetical protein F2Q70_00021575 [Brassica cretica]|uniref:Retrotransposon gag domain-containing protein n=1 Tax=Brassica cretica TaxID=69181 RepID=A0A8S9GMP4_BRACR|nr:hypothetical protein F2Q70_00021575 [Brassica cretica]